MPEDETKPEGAEDFIAPDTGNKPTVEGADREMIQELSEREKLNEIDWNTLNRVLEEDKPLREEAVSQVLSGAPDNIKDLFIGMSESTERAWLATGNLSEYEKMSREERLTKLKELVRQDAENLKIARDIIFGE